MERVHHTELWIFAFLAFVVGDTLTTAIGLSGSAIESNPFAKYVLVHYGQIGMVFVKAGIVLTLYLIYWEFDRYFEPNIDDEAAIFVGLLGLVVTTWNVYVIAVS